MDKKIRTGVELYLNDQFSGGMKGASASVQNFSQKALGAAEKVNGAFNSLAGKLASVGVTVGVGAMVAATVNIEDRVTRIGTAAGATARETNEFKRRLFEVAQMPDIKINPDSLFAAAETITGTGISLEYVEKNLRTIGLAIQGIGLSGEEAGAMFNTFEKLGYSAEETAAAMDKLADISDAGKGMGANDLIKSLPGLMEVHSAIGDTAGNMEDLFIAMQVLGRGTKSPMKAVSTFTATMNELADPAKRQELEKYFDVMIQDKTTGKMRDFADIMKDLIAAKDKAGNADKLSKLFSNSTMDAIRSYERWGGLTNELKNLGDTTDAMQKRSAQNAATLKSNITNLQTAVTTFAVNNLTEPLGKLTEFINKIAEDPKRVENAIRGITIALGGLAAVKLTAGIVSFIANLKGISGSGGASLSGLGSAAGGNGTPVFVTNWNGGSGVMGMNSASQQSLPSQNNTAGGGLPGTAALAAFMPLAMVAANTLYSVAKGAHSKLEKKEQAVPGVSNYYNLNPKARKKLWEEYNAKNGASLADDGSTRRPGGGRRHIPVSMTKEIPKAIQEQVQNRPAIPPYMQNQFGGKADMAINLKITDERVQAALSIVNNSTPVRYNLGATQQARRMGG